MIGLLSANQMITRRANVWEELEIKVETLLDINRILT